MSEVVPGQPIVTFTGGASASVKVEPGAITAVDYTVTDGYRWPLPESPPRDVYEMVSVADLLDE